MKETEIFVRLLKKGNPSENVLNGLYDFYYRDSLGRHLFSSNLDKYCFGKDDIIFLSYSKTLEMIDEYIETLPDIDPDKKKTKSNATFKKNVFVMDYEVTRKRLFASFGYKVGSKVLCIDLTNSDVVSSLCARKYEFVTLSMTPGKIASKNTYYGIKSDGSFVFAHDYSHLEKSDKEVFMTINEVKNLLSNSIDKLIEAANALCDVRTEVDCAFDNAIKD